MVCYRMPTHSEKVPVRYLPPGLTPQDRARQSRSLRRSRKEYKKGRYYTRKSLASFKNRPSHHVATARRMYHIENISPTPQLARATGCSVKAMQKIVNKGEGAYFSSGSRPNQTAQSWGFARLASALTAGKSAAVDYTILEQGCRPDAPALVLAKKARQNYGDGHGHTRRTRIISP